MQTEPDGRGLACPVANGHRPNLSRRSSEADMHLPGPSRSRIQVQAPVRGRNHHEARIPAGWNGRGDEVREVHGTENVHAELARLRPGAEHRKETPASSAA